MGYVENKNKRVRTVMIVGNDALRLLRAALVLLPPVSSDQTIPYTRPHGLLSLSDSPGNLAQWQVGDFREDDKSLINSRPWSK